MNKLNQNNARTYLTALKNVSAASFDELVTDANQQASKARVRQNINQIIDIASRDRKRILISIGD